MSHQRPGSVIILAVLRILSGLWGLASGCALIFIAVGAVLILFALLDFVLAWGIWEMHHWAWWVTMGVAVASIIGSAATLLGGNVTSIPSVLIDVVTIFLLLVPSTRQAMGVR